jgi:hypothetical protein
MSAISQKTELSVRDVLPQLLPPLPLQFDRRDDDRCAATSANMLVDRYHRDPCLAGTGNCFDHPAIAAITPSLESRLLPGIKLSSGGSRPRTRFDRHVCGVAARLTALQTEMLAGRDRVAGTCRAAQRRLAKRPDDAVPDNHQVNPCIRID